MALASSWAGEHAGYFFDQLIEEVVFCAAHAFAGVEIDGRIERAGDSCD